MKISFYSIPLELQDNSFIKSLFEQSKEKELSAKQISALKDMLDVVEELPIYETKKVKKYSQYFYRVDYHGDPLRDWSYVYDIPESKLQNEIQEVCAAYHGVESYIKEYSFVLDVEIPANITNVTYFMEEFYDDFLIISQKVQRNKFRKTKTRNAAYRALRELTTVNPKEIDSSIIEKANPKFNYSRY